MVNIKVQERLWLEKELQEFNRADKVEKLRLYLINIDKL